MLISLSSSFVEGVRRLVGVVLPVVYPLAFKGVSVLADPRDLSAPHHQTTATDPAYQGGMTMSVHGLGYKNIWVSQAVGFSHFNQCDFSWLKVLLQAVL